MSISRLITEKILKRREERQHERTSWYPSDLGLCDRKSILSRAGVEANPFSDDTLRTFWLGETIHAGLQDLIGTEDHWHEVESRGENPEVHGKIDTVRYINNEYEVIEFKSQRDSAFNYKLPKDNHIMQVGCYLTYGITDSRFPSPPRLARANIIYIGKESGRIKEFPVENTPELRAKVTAKLAELEEAYKKYLESGKLPEPLPKEWRSVAGGKRYLTEPFQVRYCDYRNTGHCCGDSR